MALTNGSTSSSSLEEERNEFEISLKIHRAHLAQSVEHAAVNCNGADRRRWRIKGGEVGAAVESCEGVISPEADFGHRKRGVV